MIFVMIDTFPIKYIFKIYIVGCAYNSKRKNYDMYVLRLNKYGTFG